MENKIHLEKQAVKHLPQFLIISLILLVYIQNLWFDFAYLDDNLIVFAEHEKIDSISKIPNTFLSGYLLDNYYRPMVMISFIIDTTIAGQSSMMYHLTNMILHIFVSLLLYKFLVKLNIRENFSLLLSLFFAVHPVNTNAVSWIVGRNDLLLTLFALISFLYFIIYQEKKRKVFLIISATAYFFSMISKEVGVLIPVIFILYILFFAEGKRLSKKDYLFIIYYLIPLTLYIFLRNVVSKIIVRDEITFHSFVKNFYILFEYIAKIFYYPLIEPLPIKNNILIIIGISFSFIIIFIYLKTTDNLENKKKIVFGLIFSLLFIIPTLFVRVKADDGEFNYIDCRIYLPIIGFLIILGALLQSLNVKLSKKAAVISILLFSIYTIGFTFIKNKTYYNGNIFWKTETELHPNRASYWMGYGFYYYYNGHFLEAAKCVETAIQIKSNIIEYYQKASLAYESAGDLIRANGVLEQSLKIEKDNPFTIMNLIKNHLKLKQMDKTNEWVIKFLRIEINDNKVKAYLNSSLSYYFAESGNYDLAIKFMKTALKIFPNNSIYNNDLGVFYLYSEKPDSAKIYFEKAVTENPNDLGYQKNLNFVNSKFK